MHKYKALLQLLLKLRKSDIADKAKVYDRLVDLEFVASETYEPDDDSKNKHAERHVELHKALDELFADYIIHHPEKSAYSSLPILELLQWSYLQTVKPTEENNG